MGDRVSISFTNGDEESVALFHHWGGKSFPREALEYASQLKMELELNHEQLISTPLARLEPRVVMVDFIRYLANTEWLANTWPGLSGRANDSIYLGKDESNGDNSDNGHFVIDLNSFTMERR